ncbi:MAG TPA: hypothetical protein VK673_10745 [Chthoniobacterales bacterium]|nr:hypothetical protein [Chthoniobacterales bacterium]
MICTLLGDAVPHPSTDWLAVLLSIPIGLFTSLVFWLITPKLEPILFKWGIWKTQAQEREYRQIERFKNEPELFTQFLVHVTIKTVLIGAVGTTLVIFCYLISEYGDIYAKTEQAKFPFRLVWMGARWISGATGIVLVIVSSQALSVWTKVTHFDTYKKALGRT